ncbi:permease [Halococcus sp. AFM35]|uniref:permease n=1 Tax=Halococcus sp. AFM35 TaxID=3421653 RepID=UPI003EBD7B8F
MSILTGIADGLGLAARMAWETWWALVLGFTLTGVIEEFVSEEYISRVLGNDDWREIGLATLFGAASSSCSFTATSTAMTLFKKGASAAAALAAFQFASTNLVIELALVMWILLGWQFVLADFVGGLIAVGVLSILYKYVFPEAWYEAARDHLLATEEIIDPVCGMTVDPDAEDVVTLDTDAGTEYFCCASCKTEYQNQQETEGTDETDTWYDRLLSVTRWKRVVRTALRQWDMLWEDIALGFLVAGFVGALVPTAWWTTLFGFGTGGTLMWVLTGSIVAVLIAAMSFVCSVGNVPFALVLWRNGIPFGSVMSFIYGDLLIPPLVDAYRRYYGLRMAAAMVGSMFLAAVAAGVSVHYLFDGLALIPPTGEAGGTPPETYIVVLNIVFTPVFLVEVYVAYGPERIVGSVRSLPEMARRLPGRAKRAARTAGERLVGVGRTVWTALRRIGRASWLVGEAIWLAGRSAWLAGIAVYIVLTTPMRIAAAVAEVVNDARQRVRRTLHEARRLRAEAASNVREARRLVVEPLRAAVQTARNVYRE